MSTLYTPTWGNSNSPRMYIDWSYSSSASSVTYSFTAYYTASYAAYTNGNARSWSVTIAGKTWSGSYNINGVTGTKTLGSGSVTVNRTHSSQTVSISISMYMDVTWNGTYGGTLSNSTTDSMNALASYTVSFNANGGSGAPSSQTKWYGETLTLSSTKPTRSGYTFAGWATSSTATSATYSAGGSYTANSAATLYAVWTASSTCTIAFNANGGSGAPSSITHIINSTTTLPSTRPTKDGCWFLGWSTSSTATSATYSAGGSYTNNSFTNGATITLYAVWKKVNQIFVNVPDGETLDSIYINIPSGSTASGIYFQV